MKRSAEDYAEAQHAAKLFKTVCDTLEIPVDKQDVFKIISDVMERQITKEVEVYKQPVEDTITRCVIYVLKLENNCFYVGRSESDEGVDLRIEAHKNGNGSQWTSKHRFVEILWRRPDSSCYEEDSVTLQMMHKYGIQNVRGGSFCNETLQSYQERILELLLVVGMYSMAYPNCLITKLLMTFNHYLQCIAQPIFECLFPPFDDHILVFPFSSPTLCEKNVICVSIVICIIGHYQVYVQDRNACQSRSRLQLTFCIWYGPRFAMLFSTFFGNLKYDCM